MSIEYPVGLGVSGFLSPAQNTAIGGLSLVLLALGVGIRHGMDPDHLAAIDAILRFQNARKRRIVRLSGLYFSLGHGIVVMGLGLLVVFLSGHFRVPSSLDLLGGLFSGLFLLGMAAANGLFLARSGRDVPFIPYGARSRTLLKIVSFDREVSIVILGMVFAISFDTFSQTIIFSLTASSLGGLGEGLAVGLAFVVGMILSDGANGLWIARLISRADARGIRLSRMMGWAVVLISLFVGFFVLGSTLFKKIISVSTLGGTLTGISIILILSLFYFIGERTLPENYS